MSRYNNWYSDIRQSFRLSQAEQRALRGEYVKPIWLHVLIIILTIVTVLAQGVVMNFYYINHFANSILPYFWFFADICNTFAFLGSLLAAHKYMRKRRRGSYGSVGVESEHKLVWQPGILPLSYISWFFYSCILVTKVCLMIHMDIVFTLSYQEFFGPSVVQVALSLSGFIFMLLVEAHVWSPHGTKQYVLATYVCTYTAIEVVDSANLLYFIHSYKSHATLGDVSRLLILPIEYVCVITFLLPTLMLYQMTMSDFQVDIMHGPIGTLFDVLHIFLLDAPVIGIRVYLWFLHDYYSSVYLMRSIFSALVTIRRLVPELADLIYMCQYIHRNPVYSSPSVYVRDFHQPKSDPALTEQTKTALDPEGTLRPILKKSERNPK